jgi:hypothetical protein
VAVVVLLAMDFWTCRVCAIGSIILSLIYLIPQNVSGRTLVGLWFWNQVDEDGESYWIFESRDVRDVSTIRMTVLNGSFVAITPRESS